jgi:hypothetical protein
MTIRVPTRRAVVFALGALSLVPTVVLAQAPAPATFRAVQVDIGPLRSSTGDPTAAWVANAMPGALVQALGPHYVPGDRNGATLIVRPASIYLCPSSGGPGPLGSCTDTIEGDLVVRGPRGGVILEAPLRAITSYFPKAVDQALVVESNKYRIELLAQAFAGWVPRQLGL